MISYFVIPAIARIIRLKAASAAAEDNSVTIEDNPSGIIFKI